ncbi:MAG: DsbC/DsbD-like thiol-disulfide interchange protein [Paracoccaceae bacterium]|jgi:DsbC/DsbD-like thiol-disulfide interchange protein
MDENFAYLLRAATLAAAVIAGPALAGGPYASTALLTGWAEDEGARIAGLSIELAPGWKTYWRQPGDAGVPPRFDWSGSDNVAEVTVIWPRPHAFDSFGYRTIGYKDAVTLPLRVVAVDPSMPVTLRLSFDYGVCSDICVPARDELSLLIAPGEGGATPAIAAALVARITPAAEAGLSVERCTIAGAGDARRFEGVFRPSAPFAALPVVVIEAGEDFWFAPAEVTVKDGLIHASAAMESMTPGAWIDRTAIDVTLLGDDQAIAVAACGG